MILDNDILIDLNRRHPAAVAWLRSLADPPPAAGFAVMEFLNGARNNREWDTLERFLRDFQAAWPSEAGMDFARLHFTRYRLSHGVGMIDTLIAITALEMDEPLATFNIRHFSAIAGLRLVQPYQR